MRVFAVSDVHVDYQENQMWLYSLSDFDYQQDILIVAGDLSDNVALLEASFKALVKKFYRVIFVVGNHDLWVRRNKTINSIEKFHLVNDIALQSGIHLDVFEYSREHQRVIIAPLLSWYDYSFAKPCNKLKMTWMDYRQCQWPNNMDDEDITQFFLEQNHKVMAIINATSDCKLISFSHFLPRIDLMPKSIPDKYRYIFPALGCEGLERQIRQIKPDIHVYGHSHLNRKIEIDGIVYMNNAFGYPHETTIANKQLLCVYEN